MKGIELLKEHPKAAIVIKQWFLEKMLEGLNDESLPDDFKVYVREQGIDDDKVGVFIDASPRGLFDIFDEHKILISIIAHQNDSFSVKINGVEDLYEKFSTRKLADHFAIEHAFKMLNEKL